MEYRKAPVVVRPPTPELRAPVAENDEKRLAVIFLERILRGRAVLLERERERDIYIYSSYIYIERGIFIYI